MKLFIFYFYFIKRILNIHTNENFIKFIYNDTYIYMLIYLIFYYCYHSYTIKK